MSRLENLIQPFMQEAQGAEPSATIYVHFPALLAWCKDAEAVLEKVAEEGWVSDVLTAESREGLFKSVLALKREARGVLLQPNA
jgi:hypothetical protein